MFVECRGFDGAAGREMLQLMTLRVALREPAWWVGLAAVGVAAADVVAVIATAVDETKGTLDERSVYIFIR